MKINLKSRIFSIVLAVLMLVSVLPMAAFAETDDVAKIVRNGVKYTKLSDAIDAAEDGDTVELLMDSIGKDNEWTVNANTAKNITVDLKGHTVQPSSGDAFTAASGCGLTIKDSVGGGTVIAHTGDGIIYAKGPVTITGGTYVTNPSGGFAYVRPAYSLTITGGTFNVDPSEYVTDKENYEVTYNENDGTWTVSANATAVAKIGNVEYETLDEALAAAETGETVEIVKAGAYTPASIPKNITISAAVDGVVFDYSAKSGQLCSIPNGVTINNVTLKFGKNGYTGFQHAGTINMNNCTLNGLFLSYGNMNFTDCTFNAPGTEESGIKDVDYSMWLYAGNISFDNCTFNGAGKFFNVYSEVNAPVVIETGERAPWNISVNNCTAFSSNSNKAVFNVKEACGTLALAYDVDFDGTNVAVGSFPTAGENGVLKVLNGFVQVDDRLLEGTEKGSNITVESTSDAKLAVLTVEEYNSVKDDKTALETKIAEKANKMDASYETPSQKSSIAKIGNEEYETIAEAVNKSKSGDEIVLLADLNDIGNISLKENVTLNGDNHTISGESCVRISTKGATVKNVNFENIHNNTPVEQENLDLYNWEAHNGKQSAIYAEYLESGTLTVTGCTFDNVDWDAIQIVPVKNPTAKVIITDNTFKHTNKDAYQLRYVHIQYTIDVYPQNMEINLTDNIFKDNSNTPSANKIESVGIYRIKPDNASVSGNYFEDVTTIDGDYIPYSAFYPMRTNADVDVDDKNYSGAAEIGNVIYQSLEEAIAVSNANGGNTTITLIDDVVINETIEINKAGSPSAYTLIELDGHILTAKTTAFNAVTPISLSNPTGYAILPEEAPFITGTVGVIYGYFSNKNIEEYINQHKYHAVQNGDWWEIINWDDASAAANGYNVRVPGNEYYSTMAEAYASKTSVTLVADVTENVAVSGKALSINLNSHRFVGSLKADSDRSVTLSDTNTRVNGVFGYYGSAYFTSIEANQLKLQTDYPINVTIAGGYVQEIPAVNNQGKAYNLNGLNIIGGTFGFDPTCYVDTSKYEVVNNGDGTWTVDNMNIEVVENNDEETSGVEVNEIVDESTKNPITDKGTIYTTEETAGTNATTTVAEVIKALNENTEVKSFASTVKTATETSGALLNIKLKAIDVLNTQAVQQTDTVKTTVKTAKFDVKPLDEEGNVVPNSKITEAVTFRLPVYDEANEFASAKVFHNGKYIGTFTIDGTNEKYIELSAREFSEYSYELIKEEINSSDKNINYYASLTLGDNIDVNFYVEVPTGTSVEGYTVRSTFNGVEFVEVDLNDIESTVNDGNDSRKIVVANVFSYQMICPIVIEVYKDGNLVESFDYSVQKYCLDTIADYEDSNDQKDVKLVTLCRAALDYGANAQLSFSGKTYNGDQVYPVAEFGKDQLANTPTNPENGIDATKPDKVFDKNSYTDSDNIKFCGVSLILGSEVSLKMYFDYTGAGTPELSWFSIAGEDNELVLQEVGNGKWAVKITGIKSYQLSNEFVLTVNNGSENASITYSAYAYAGYNWESSDTYLAKLCQALVNYGNAALDYFNLIND